jgi:hypothetical protein
MSIAAGNRRILVIGSQCDALGDSCRLSFLPQAAEELYRMMIDPERGQCLPARAERSLLIDPTVGDARSAIIDAFRRASEQQTTLILAYVGHATSARERFYVLPRDAEVPPRADTALHLVELIDELYVNNPDAAIDGLVVLIDACYSGFGAAGAAKHWADDLSRTRRFEVLTASGDRPAYDGCFTRTLTACLRDGIDEEPSDYLRCEHVRRVIRNACPKQEPRHAGNHFDRGLYLARNGARTRPAWAGTWAAGEIARLTADFQPTPVLEGVVAASRKHRSVALLGLAGTGKSTLAAVLMRPEVCERAVPAGFAHAIAFLSGSLSAQDLARKLSDQLARAVPGFPVARDDFARALTEEERRRIDSLQLGVVGPLRRLQPLDGMVVRVVVDALDKAPSASESSIRDALHELAAGPGLDHVRLIVTARPDTALPSGSSAVRVVEVDDEHLGQYLTRRGVAPNLRGGIIQRAGGNWLVAAKLADLVLTAPEQPLDELSGLTEIYAEYLRRAGATSTDHWRREMRPVLGTLAAAGVGPILPMPLLCAASARLGGPARPYRVRDILVDLRGLVVRDRPGTDDEHVGLFHQTFAEYVLDPMVTFGIDAGEPHCALADALSELAPLDEHDPGSALHRYAMAREAEHLWAIGRHTQALEILSRRESAIPAENLVRWQSWHDRIAKQLVKDHPGTLRTRHRVAFWTGAVGDARGALRLFRELLPDRERVLGKDHPDTLATRNNVATWTGAVGDARGALRLFGELLPDQQRVRGKDHPDTLATRNNLAAWTGEVRDAPEALRLFRELLPDQQRVLGEDHPDTLTTRHNVAYWTGRSGDAPAALRLSRELLPDRERVLGKDHPHTFITRNNIAAWTGETGDSREALRLSRELLRDRQRVLGSDHPDTLATRHNVATWTGRAGKAPEALRLLRELLPDQERVLGKDHPQTHGTRAQIDYWRDQLAGG